MKKNRKATLRDAARKANVGIATATRVINARGSMSAARLATVLATVQQLGYEADHAARVLRGGRTKIVGLILPTISDPYFSSCVASIERVARQRYSALMLALSHDNLTEELVRLEQVLSNSLQPESDNRDHSIPTGRQRPCNKLRTISVTKDINLRRKRMLSLYK